MTRIEAIAVSKLRFLSIVAVQRIGNPDGLNLSPIFLDAWFNPGVQRLPPLFEAQVEFAAIGVEPFEPVPRVEGELERNIANEAHATRGAICEKVPALMQMRWNRTWSALFIG